ncbi:HNH endonuclease signature motif containing protein [Flexivirga lutea]
MLILLRDQVCRTPWCGAPIRHTDHIRPHATRGATIERNGEGLCARCHYVKEHPDYEVTGDAGETTIRTAGLTARSHPLAPPGFATAHRVAPRTPADRRHLETHREPARDRPRRPTIGAGRAVR